ncbi:MAG: transposase [Planctomycetes bacterium]|nr:transposase [Planctomycetota bacterium]
MTIARSHLVDPSRAGAYHLVSRCVRRGFLCGDQWDHRRQWIHDAVREQAGAFAIDILAYAVMANHFHLVVATHPERVAAWSARAVAERWAVAYPRRDHSGQALPPDPAEIDRRANDATWVDRHRGRLGSVSWFMKVMKERIARRANREDGCTGSFWQGRFTSVALLDQLAVIACMAYVDLNPIRARQATTPESSLMTSIHDRVDARQLHRIAAGVRTRTGASGGPPAIIAVPDPQAGLWITPIERCTPGSDAAQALAPCPISLDSYLELVDTTGRIVLSGKRGAIPAELAPILARLEIDAEQWIDAMMNGGRFLGSAIGSAVARAGEAVRRGVKWVVDRLRLHRATAAA